MLDKLYIAPGNAGTSQYGTNVALWPLDFSAVKQFCTDHAVDMIVVGNEDPLVAGIVDYMGANAPQLLVVGPTAAGAQLEGSKDFAKRFMTDHNIPTAKYRSFTSATLRRRQKIPRHTQSALCA